MAKARKSCTPGFPDIKILEHILDESALGAEKLRGRAGGGVSLFKEEREASGQESFAADIQEIPRILRERCHKRHLCFLLIDSTLFDTHPALTFIIREICLHAFERRSIPPHPTFIHRMRRKLVSSKVVCKERESGALSANYCLSRIFFPEASFFLKGVERFCEAPFEKSYEKFLFFPPFFCFLFLFFFFFRWHRRSTIDR